MAGWSDWYSGTMAPPLKVPGGYLPAPATQAPMSVEDIYRGIYGPASGGLISRSVKTVPVPMSVNANAQFGVGTGMRGSVAVDGRRKVEIPNPVYGPDPVPKYQDRLPAVPAGLPLAAPMVSARGQLGAGGFGGGSFSLPRVPTAPDDGIIDLSTLDLSDRGAQGMADSQGAPVRAKSGKVYYPGGKASTAPRSTPAAAPSQRRGLLGALFGNNQGGGLFSGGNREPVAITVRGGNSGPATYTPQGNLHPGSLYDNSGNDMAFMPQAYRDNPRNSNGGY